MNPDVPQLRGNFRIIDVNDDANYPQTYYSFPLKENKSLLNSHKNFNSSADNFTCIQKNSEKQEWIQGNCTKLP